MITAVVTKGDKILLIQDEHDKWELPLVEKRRTESEPEALRRRLLGLGISHVSIYKRNLFWICLTEDRAQGWFTTEQMQVLDLGPFAREWESESWNHD